MIFTVSSIFLALMILVGVAFFTLIERKLLSVVQNRKGPDKVGPLKGVLQSMADAVKLFSKEVVSLYSSEKYLFYLGPLISVVLALFLWSLIPTLNGLSPIQFSFLIFMSVSSLGVYGLFISGWSSNNKYALLGAMRGIAQSVSYEIPFCALILIVFFCFFSSSMLKISLLKWTSCFIFFFPLLIMWLAVSLCESNRTPFDFSEGESELVSGFNIEFSGVLFSIIFMAEYASIMLMSKITSLVFFYFISVGDLMLTLFFMSWWIWVRATLPRFRYDLLMSLNWKTYIPIVSFGLMFVVTI